MTDLLDASSDPTARPAPSGVDDTTEPPSTGVPPTIPGDHLSAVAPPRPVAAPAIATGSRLVDRHLAGGHDLDLIAAPVGRTIVVVPHPDDEALAVGGLIAHQRARGRDVVVVAVTDGDAAYPDWDGVELARLRRREQLDSLHRLGVGRRALHRLGVPDGAVGHHVDDIATELLELVTPGDTLVAPAEFDWHPDHEACGRAAAAVAAETRCPLFGSLFWAHHHPERAPAELWLGVLALSDGEVAHRRAALSSHRSQLQAMPQTTAGPILTRDVLGLLGRPVEYYVLDRAGPGPRPLTGDPRR